MILNQTIWVRFPVTILMKEKKEKKIKERKRKENVGLYCRKCKIRWAELQPPCVYCTICREFLAEETRKKIESYKLV